ncbi:MAG: SsrA-binding protein SmpB [Oscillospiraceae bacterium]|nr:SsrA-binding protein SmpB [Oscillospiraceae bacterium]
MSPKTAGIKQIAQNKKAYHDYFILGKYEAGVELFGTEVKSIRAGNINLKDAFCVVKNGELFTHGMRISPYEKGNIFNRDPMRPKRLLMHKREIVRLYGRIKQDGLALIPLSVYMKDSRVKLELGLARGKKLHDKREAAAEMTSRREMDRNLKLNTARRSDRVSE